MKRDVILETAARLFAERGFTNTPTSLLAKEAGVAEGTIFRHFRTKDDIFLTLIHNVKTQLITDIENYIEVRGPENPLEKLESVIKSFYVFVRKNSMEFCLIFRDAPTRFGQRNDDVFVQIREIYTYVIDYMQTAIDEGKQDGSITTSLPSQDVANLIMSTMVGLVRATHFGFSHVNDDIVKSVVECYTKILTE